MNYKKNKWNKKDEQFLIDNIQTMSNRELSKKLNRSKKSISAKLHRLSITRGDYKFTKYTEKNDVYNKKNVLGYICGLIATDGSISINPCKRVALYLHYQDESVLNFVVNTLILEKYVLKNNKKNNVIGFTITAPTFIQYLENMGIVNNKTKTLDVKLDDKSDIFQLYFLRGVIDGDGCVVIRPKLSTSYISITSSSQKFLLSLQAYFGGNIYKRKTGYYDLTWKGYEARNFAKLLPLDSFTMKRKTKLIQNLKKCEFANEKTIYGHGIQKRGNRYIARIQYNKKRINLGSFKTLKDAQIAYNKKAVELLGDKAKLNKCG